MNKSKAYEAKIDMRFYLIASNKTKRKFRENPVFFGNLLLGICLPSRISHFPLLSLDLADVLEVDDDDFSFQSG